MNTRDKILNHLETNIPTSAPQFAKLLGCQKSHINLLLRDLIADGLVEVDRISNSVKHYRLQGAWVGYQVGLHILQQQPIAAYQDDYGNAVSAGDFDGGEDEMHETAHQEGWTPLVCAAGIKVKE